MTAPVYAVGAQVRALGFLGWLSVDRISGTVTTAQQAGQYVNRAAGYSPNVNAVVMPFAGSLCGLSNRLFNAAATGTNTVQAYKNGSPVSGATAVMSGTTQFGTASFASGVYSFSAGDCIDLRVTSSAWSQANGGVYYYLWVYFQ